MARTLDLRRHTGTFSVFYSFPHAIGAPGIGWTAWNQVTELVALGHPVHLVAANVARPIPGLASLTTTLDVGPVRVPQRVLGRSRAWALHDRIAAGLVARVRPDVVHTWPLAGIRTMRAGAAIDIPTVREAPNTHTGHAYEVVAAEHAALGLPLRPGSSHAFNPKRLQAEQREWDVATAVLAPSDAVARSFVERGLDPERLVRHRYGYRPDDARAHDRPADRPADRPFTAIFLGRGEPRKGLHFALQAWRASRASATGRFVIYGQLLPEYARLLAPLLDHPSVEVHGFTDDPLGALADADVLLLPSIEEGSALITYEAQGVGCVPLVSAASGAELTHGREGLVHDTRDVGQLTAHLNTLSSSPAELARMRRNALDHAPELTWAAAARSLENAYVRAAGILEGAHSAIV
jgi:glycosyltransferase involved in cell wall biosynthesis